MSPPSRGAWIEILYLGEAKAGYRRSPPSRGAWIEMNSRSRGLLLKSSPPSRGAWIEMPIWTRISWKLLVAPLAGGVD